mgnify:CR=1 FL=1
MTECRGREPLPNAPGLCALARRMGSPIQRHSQQRLIAAVGWVTTLMDDGPARGPQP